MGVDLVNAPLLLHYERYFATTLGRDKALRLIQSLARLISWTLLRKIDGSRAIAACTKLASQIALTRRYVRFGNQVFQLRAALRALRNVDQDEVTRYASAGRGLGYATYLTLDSIILVGSIADWNQKVLAVVQKSALRAWCTGIVCSLIASLYTLHILQSGVDKRSKQHGQNSASEGKAVVKQPSLTNIFASLRLQILCDLCDLMIVLSNLGTIRYNDGIVGGCGVISSIIGIFKQWRVTSL